MFEHSSCLPLTYLQLTVLSDSDVLLHHNQAFVSHLQVACRTDQVNVHTYTHSYDSCSVWSCAQKMISMATHPLQGSVQHNGLSGCLSVLVSVFQLNTLGKLTSLCNTLSSSTARPFLFLKTMSAACTACDHLSCVCDYCQTHNLCTFDLLTPL